MSFLRIYYRSNLLKAVITLPSVQFNGICITDPEKWESGRPFMRTPRTNIAEGLMKISYILTLPPV